MNICLPNIIMVVWTLGHRLGFLGDQRKICCPNTGSAFSSSQKKSHAEAHLKQGIIRHFQRILQSNVYHKSRSTTKPTKWHMRPAKTQPGAGIRAVWSIFAVRPMESLGPKVSSCRQWRLIRLGKCTGWSESSLGAHVILLVLSRCSSIIIYANDK